MIIWNKAELGAKAKELCFVRDTLEKVLRLIDVLTFINSNPTTRDNLVLKGGTAINLTVFDLPRLSVDIDLDISRNMSRDEMLELRKRIRKDIHTFMTSEGYTVSENSKQYFILDSYVFNYINKGGAKDNIKIEINYSLRSHIFESVEKEVALSGLGKYGTIRVLQPIELFASKINALLSRTAIRDLYDVYNMIRNKVFDQSNLHLLRKCVVFYTAISQERVPMEYDFSHIDTNTVSKVKTGLLTVIKIGENFELEKVKKEVKAYLEELLVLEPQEKEFLYRFSNKEYCPELLFDDQEILARIRNHPMALWKCSGYETVKS